VIWRKLVPSKPQLENSCIAALKMASLSEAFVSIIGSAAGLSSAPPEA
jgi:hypothetical protein